MSIKANNYLNESTRSQTKLASTNA